MPWANGGATHQHLRRAALPSWRRRRQEGGGNIILIRFHLAVAGRGGAGRGAGRWEAQSDEPAKAGESGQEEAAAAAAPKAADRGEKEGALLGHGDSGWGTCCKQLDAAEAAAD